MNFFFLQQFKDAFPFPSDLYCFWQEDYYSCCYYPLGNGPFFSYCFKDFIFNPWIWADWLCCVFTTFTVSCLGFSNDLLSYKSGTNDFLVVSLKERQPPSEYTIFGFWTCCLLDMVTRYIAIEAISLLLGSCWYWTSNPWRLEGLFSLIFLFWNGSV